VSSLCAIATKILNIIVYHVFSFVIASCIRPPRPARMSPTFDSPHYVQSRKQVRCSQSMDLLPCPVAGTSKFLSPAQMKLVFILVRCHTVILVTCAYENSPRISEAIHTTKSHNSNLMNSRHEALILGDGNVARFLARGTLSLHSTNLIFTCETHMLH